jgi:hypothetical protein
MAGRGAWRLDGGARRVEKGAGRSMANGEMVGSSAVLCTAHWDSHAEDATRLHGACNPSERDEVMHACNGMRVLPARRRT